VLQIIRLTLKMKVLILIVVFVFKIPSSLQQEPVPCSLCEPRFEYDYRLLTRLIELETAQRDALTLISQLQADNVELRRKINGKAKIKYYFLTLLYDLSTYTCTLCLSIQQ